MTIAHGEPATAGRGSVMVVAICAAVLFGDGFDAVAMSFAAPRIAAQLGLAPAAMALPIVAAPIGAALGAVALGHLGDRIGRKRLLIGGTLVLAVATLLTATAGSIGMLTLWRFLTGIGIGASSPAAAALTADHAPARLRATAVTFAFCGLSIGSIVAGIIATPLIARFDWPAIFVAGGLTSALALPLAIAFLPRGSGAERAVTNAGPAGIGAVLAGRLRRATPLLWLLVMANGVAYALLSYWLPTLVTSAGFGFGIAVAAGTLMHLGGLAGCLVQGWLIDRIGPWRTLGSAFVLGATGMLVLGLADGATMLLAGSLCLGLGIEGSLIGIGAFAASFYAAPIRSTGMGWVTGAGRLGGVMGPALAGLLLRGGWPAREVVIAAAVPTVIAFFALLALRRVTGGAREAAA